MTAEDIYLNKCAKTGDAKFSIMIPSWNNLPYLQLCINSIRKNSIFRHQLIVHINEGKDGSLEWIKEQEDIDYSYSKENIGVCYALNTCRAMVDTSYIVYMNDDMYACPNWDKELHDEIEKIGHKYFFLSSTVIEPVTLNNCTIEKNYGTSVTSFDENKLLDEYALLPMFDWQGATWPPNIIHKDIWDLAGGYSIEFSPGMYSDPDFSMKLWLIGVRIFKGLEKSRVYHFGSVSVKRVKQNKGYYTFVSKWGITQNTFAKYYLRRGEKYTGPLAEPTFSSARKLNNTFKQLKAVFLRKNS
jgi:glycosyltransferase involved in cell wall biosynthesis